MRIIFLCILSFWLCGAHFTVSADKGASSIAKTEMIPWNEVNQLIPKYSKFIVKDVLTGKEFRVQRRAGSRHADVQPLTNEDTKIMKEIYQGKWSWKRRAIVVIHDKKKIAASMHGMPHGAGALQNNFPGHFCIHFYGSTTHRRNFMDLSHKLMILKAAGKLEKYLQKVNPYELVSAFVAGIKEDDEWIVDLTTVQDGDWANHLYIVDSVAITSMPMLPDEDLEGVMRLSIPIEIDWLMKEQGRKRVSGEIHLIRFSPYGSWKIDGTTFIEDHFKNNA